MRAGEIRQGFRTPLEQAVAQWSEANFPAGQVMAQGLGLAEVFESEPSGLMLVWKNYFGFEVEALVAGTESG